MDKFAIITNTEKDKNYKVTKRIREYLTEKGKSCILPRRLFKNDGQGMYTDSGDIPDDVDCILVLGGDGTFLQTARDMMYRDIPLLGINMGTLGFLTSVELTEIESSLDALIQGEYEIEDRIMLQGRVFRNGEMIKESMALNDIVITRAGFSRLVELKIFINDVLMDIYAADGVIVATPTGSTGYNLSAGGPVVLPGTGTMVISPICPHSLTARSVVVTGKDRIRVQVGKRRKTQLEEALVTYDGEAGVELEPYDTVEIIKAGVVTQFVKMHNRSFYEILRNKLGAQKGD